MKQHAALTCKAVVFVVCVALMKRSLRPVSRCSTAIGPAWVRLWLSIGDNTCHPARSEEASDASHEFMRIGGAMRMALRLAYPREARQTLYTPVSQYYLAYKQQT